MSYLFNVPVLSLSHDGKGWGRVLEHWAIVSSTSLIGYNVGIMVTCRIFSGGGGLAPFTKTCTSHGMYPACSLDGSFRPKCHVGMKIVKNLQGKVPIHILFGCREQVRQYSILFTVASYL